MGSGVVQPGEGVHSERTTPYRRIFVVVETLVALSGAAGTWQLVTGAYTPSLSRLPFGLHSWVLPGLWLFGTVAAPAAVAAWLAWRRSDATPDAVLVASATMSLELLVQIPFLGVNLLQVVFGGVALVLAGLASQARRDGWRH